MTEITTTPEPAAAPTPEPTVNTNPMALDAAQIASAREHWVSLGFDPAAFDKALSGEVAAPAAPQANGGPQDPDPAVAVLSATKTPTVTAAEAQQMAEALIAQGVPRETVEAALKADGLTLAPDTRNEDQIEWDRAFAPGAPEDYKINFMGHVPADMDLTQLAHANARATQWLAAVGFPPEIGPAVIERAMDVGQAYARMSDPGRELWKREQVATFMRMAGSEERAAELRGFAADMLRRDAAYALMLDKAGALCDAGVFMHLALQGERLKARGG